MNQKIRQFIPAAAAVIILFILMISGVYRCPLNFFLGIPCPLCGFTRAMKSVIHGDPASAFYYHPLWPVVVLYCSFCLLSRLKLIRPSSKLMNAFGFLLCFLLIACFILRHIEGSPIVKIHFESSFIYTVFNKIKTTADTIPAVVFKIRI